MKRLAALLLAIALFFSACTNIIIKGRGEGPLTADERIELAAIYESNGETELALREYAGAVEADPKYAKAHFSLGNFHLRTNNYGDALKSLRDAIKIDPMNAPYYNNAGWALMELGELDRAERIVAEALTLDPTGAHAYLDTIGVILTRKGRYLDAEETFFKAVKEAGGKAENKEALKHIFNHLLELYRASGEKEKLTILEEKLKGL